MRYNNIPLLIGLAVFFLFCDLCRAEDTVVMGSSEEQIISAMGEPTGRVVSENVVSLEYPQVGIKLKDNKVVDLWENEVKKTSRTTVEAISVQPKQIPVVKKKIALEKPTKKKTKKYKKIKSINDKGKRVDLDSLLVPGKVTIIDFYAQWCSPCSVISPKLEKLACKYKNVYLRKVNINKWKSPVAKQFRIKSVPNVWIYDKNGNMAGEPTSSFKYIKKYVNLAK